MKQKILIVVFVFLQIFQSELKAQINVGDSSYKILKNQLSFYITKNIHQLAKACNNSFFFLAYSLDSNMSVSYNLVGTDSTVKAILKQAQFDELNKYVISYAKAIGIKNVSFIQPFYIGCIESKTWVDMPDLIPLYYKIDKLPGSKILLEFLEFDMIH